MQTLYCTHYQPSTLHAVNIAGNVTKMHPLSLSRASGHYAVKQCSAGCDLWAGKRIGEADWNSSSVFGGGRRNAGGEHARRRFTCSNLFHHHVEGIIELRTFREYPPQAIKSQSGIKL